MHDTDGREACGVCATERCHLYHSDQIACGAYTQHHVHTLHQPVANKSGGSGVVPTLCSINWMSDGVLMLLWCCRGSVLDSPSRCTVQPEAGAIL